LLREKGVTAEEVNYAKAGLDEATIREIVKAVGSVGAALNPRHALVKERGWEAKPPSIDELVTAAVADANVLRRPILVAGKKVIVGYTKANQAEWAKLT
jgi:arsenate reductase-like glutaredoxin family protein